MIPEKPKTISFNEYIDKYFIPHFMKNKSAKNWIYIIKHYCNAFGNQALDKITPAMIEQTTLSYTNGKSSSTLNNFISTIHRIFQYAIEIELLDKNPAKLKKSREDNTRRRFLNEAERKALIESCKQSDRPYLLPMVYISLLGGLRVNEIRTLRREDVRDGCIYIRAEVAKSKKGRAIPMNKELTEVMSKATYDYNKNINRSFTSAVKRAGLDNVWFHDLRRTFGSMLAQAGVPIFDIAKLMGHGNVQITAKIYAHLLPENLQNAVGKIKL
jgi:integrase